VTATPAAGLVPATRRINRGRGHSYLLDGDTADGVTSIVGEGVPKKALIDWAARITAGYAVDHWDELAQLGLAERLRRLEKARWADRDSAGVRGTAVHALAHRLAAGEEVDVPDPLVGHVDAYLQFVKEWQPEELLVEAVVANRQWRYMGTLDLVARLADGKTWLLDWKTSASGVWPESALQLAGYANCDFHLGPQGEELPLPPIDAAGCVWLRADGYDLVPVDISEQTFRVFLYAQQLARFVHEPRETHVGEALQPPTQEARQ
jgi:hypothetical protein